MVAFASTLVTLGSLLGFPRAAGATPRALQATSSCAQTGTPAQGLVTEDDNAVQTVVNTIATDGVPGYTTYQVALIMSPEVSNVYTIYGDSRPLEFPPAYQVPTPFGTSLCGANPSFFSYSPTAPYDSWLTIGLTEGDTANAISSIGRRLIRRNNQHRLHFLLLLLQLLLLSRRRGALRGNPAPR